jgi:aerobic carbon-monoxide dehydrogenase medium subunit
VKPATFEHHAPESVGDAVGLLAEHGDEAKVLAGGQSLVPMLAMRLTHFPHLVDLNRVDELIGVDRRNGTLTIGTMTRQAAVEHTPEAAAVPLLGLAMPLIGHTQIRNRGTVGGSIAHADPAAELPAVALALDAQMEIASSNGSRDVSAREFFTGTWETAIADGELLTAIHLPVWSGRCGFALEEVARRHGDFALVGAACALRLDGAGAIEHARIAMLGVDSTPLRADTAETALAGATPTPDDLDAAAQLAVRELDPPDDIHASAAYRRRVGTHVIRRALAHALAEARNA